jgi:hypothetical protein
MQTKIQIATGKDKSRWRQLVDEMNDAFKEEPREATAELMLEHYYAERRKRDEVFREVEKVATQPAPVSDAEKLHEQRANNINKLISNNMLVKVGNDYIPVFTPEELEKAKVNVPSYVRKEAQSQLGFASVANVKGIEYEIV